MLGGPVSDCFTLTPSTNIFFPFAFQGIYDSHIELNSYPFLDNKGEYPYSTIAVQVMRPGPGIQFGDFM